MGLFCANLQWIKANISTRIKKKQWNNGICKFSCRTNRDYLRPEVFIHFKHKHKLNVVVIRLGSTMSVIVFQSGISSTPLELRVKISSYLSKMLACAHNHVKVQTNNNMCCIIARAAIFTFYLCSSWNGSFQIHLL